MEEATHYTHSGHIPELSPLLTDAPPCWEPELVTRYGHAPRGCQIRHMLQSRYTPYLCRWDAHSKHTTMLKHGTWMACCRWAGGSATADPHSCSAVLPSLTHTTCAWAATTTLIKGSRHTMSSHAGRLRDRVHPAHDL
jgi:hypothetical protein